MKMMIPKSSGRAATTFAVTMPLTFVSSNSPLGELICPGLTTVAVETWKTAADDGRATKAASKQRLTAGRLNVLDFFMIVSSIA
jgi:hypothetical protein